MKPLVRTLLQLQAICIFWGIFTVGLVRCDHGDELFEMKLVPPITEVVHFENDSYIVACQANNTRVRWFNPRNQWIDPLNRRGRIHVEEHGNETVLMFTSIYMQDNGNWRCQAERLNKSISFTMIVYKPISFVDTPNVQSVKEGEDAFIKCMTTGDPEPSISWYYNGEPLNLDNKKYDKLGDGLSIKKVLKNDSGEYTCKAFQISPTLSNVKEQTIRLNVQHKPIKPVHRESADIQYGYLKGNVNVTCEAVAEPPAQFQWFRNGKQMHPKHHLILSGEHMSVLQLYLNNSSLFGEYVCEAKNSLGTLKRTITLINGTKPAAPLHITLRGVNSNTFDLDVGAKRQGKSDPMEVNGYRFELLSKEDHRNSGGKWTNARVVVKDFTDGVTYLINNLSQNTTYLIRVASKNAAGLSDWMGPKEFHTHAKAAFGTHADNSASEKAVFSLFLTFLMFSLNQMFQFNITNNNF